MREVDVVIPVYAGLEETRQCIASALATLDPAWARIVVVNDASPEPEITAWLRTLDTATGALVLLENALNRGFVGTANRGIEYDLTRDVVLLNSDVEVANDWLHRLRAAAYDNPSVASVTPFANNATICSLPDFCRDNPLLFDLSPAQLDAACARLFNSQQVFDVPTGVGCCLYLRRDALDGVGLLDEVSFGRGYGEENDWCQRALAAGWRNVHLSNCFVYHKGGVSFGQENNSRVAAAQQILDHKYPHYHADVQRYIAADPAREARLRVWLTLFAQQQRPKLLMITHKIGGGAQQHVDELALQLQQRALVLQLTPHEDGESVTLTCFDAGRRLRDGLYFNVARDYPRLLDLLRQLGVGRVHFHHTLGLAPRLWLLPKDLGCDYDLTVHDFYLINGNPTLTDGQARYVDENSADFDVRCAEHYPLPPEVDASGWRENQKLLIEGADRVIFPSADAHAHFSRFFTVPGAVVAWHPDYARSRPYPEPTWRYTGGRALRVLVLGALSREKGADVLDSVAMAVPGQLAQFHLLGYAYRGLHEKVIAHGPYDNNRVHELVQAIDADVVWYPAQWPETYSYTLSVALHNGLPVVVPDIGAFGERVAERGHTVVQPWDTTSTQWVEFWSQVASGAALPGGGTGPAQAVETDFYEQAYLAPCPARTGAMDESLLAQLPSHMHAHREEQMSRRERVLAHLWALSRRPLVARAVALIPFRWQQAVKRRLSRRPLHDIIRNQ